MKRGSAIILLLMGILVIGLLATMIGRQGTTSAGGMDPKTAIDRSWDALCATNKVQITQMLQLYSINNEPMKTLDLDRLFSPNRFPEPPKGCPCRYSLSPDGRVVCSVHK